ncbi:hypothetical protein GLOIN_2v1620989 [Rhizophagus irregularis DAOM 181602=DAOM 197198]|uniref:Uncharacterized protein n=1 Tax=Rhizophagus irregularis (strain DAOM 181602 / DAOM 197198 / MUCL 43194) TaxID=747089 RepID=U9UBM0_RHIID|nr:hypothetical protein GLOIN_2v1620989 [Rhizophagus irregularis DAOM 181602=DAOM 197198]
MAKLILDIAKEIVCNHATCSAHDNREGEYLSEKYVNRSLPKDVLIVKGQAKNVPQSKNMNSTSTIHSLDLLEIQGKQHEQHVKHFHKDPVKFDACSDQKELCEENGICSKICLVLRGSIRSHSKSSLRVGSCWIKNLRFHSFIRL